MNAMLLESHAPIESSPLQWREVPTPHAGEGEIRVRVNVCALCRTDLHVIEGELPQAKMPVIPGHQIVGVVDELGEGATRFKKGQRVGIAWLRGTDGTCPFCRRGMENLCRASRYTGYHADGGYAEHAIVGEAFAYELPEGLGDAEISPLLCAGLIGYRSLKLARVPEKGKLLLVGFGSSAHIVLQLAVHRGHRVYVLSRGEGHRKLSLELGAAWAGEDAGALPEKMESAILFAPAGGLVPPVLEALDRGGTLSLAGIHMSDVPALNYQKHLYHEKKLVSVMANTREDGGELLAEAVVAKVRPHIREYPLRDANRALLEMKQSRIDGTGVLVVE